MLHCQDPKTIKKNQDFPNSIEVQLLGGFGKGDRGTLNICTPGTHLHWNGKLTKAHVINTKGPTFHGDQWVTVEIEVRGDQFKHIAEGKVVLQIRKDPTERRVSSHQRLYFHSGGDCTHSVQINRIDGSERQSQGIDRVI
jgi:hypothetical protein